MDSAYDNFWARQHPPHVLFAEQGVTHGIYQARASDMAYEVMKAWIVSFLISSFSHSR